MDSLFNDNQPPEPLPIIHHNPGLLRNYYPQQAISHFPPTTGITVKIYQQAASFVGATLQLPYSRQLE